MKKLIILAALLLLSSLVPQKAQAAVINPNADSHVVFYIPHQDDEALTFGVAILNHVMAGHNVHIALLTDGSASGVRTKLGMTVSDFVDARNREFEMSLAMLGIKPNNITYHNVTDGTLTQTQAANIIRSYEAKYPNAKHKAFSYTDAHTDHATTGKALKSLADTGVVSDARYYISPLATTSLATTKEGYSAYYKNFLLAVSSAYNVNNSVLGLYGIGHRSVPELFADFEAQPTSRFHK